MKPTFTRPLIAVLGTVALSATLFGCTPATTPEQELSSASHAPKHMSAREYTPAYLGQANDGETYSITFDDYGWTGNFLAGSMSKNLNFYVWGTFTNKGDDRYRLNSSSEAEFELNGAYALYAATDILEGDVIRDDSYVYPGETVRFVTRVAVPTEMRKSITSVVMPFTLFKAGFEGNGYVTHTSEPIGQFILALTPEQEIDNW